MIEQLICSVYRNYLSGARFWLDSNKDIYVVSILWPQRIQLMPDLDEFLKKYLI